MILCSKYWCRHVCPPYWTSGRKKLALNNPGVPHRELKPPWPCRAPCHTHPAPDIHQACCLYQKLIILLRVDVCLLVFFLGICCNYVYIHSGDMPLICARVWANGFKVCLFLCVCVCCQHTSLKWILICRRGAWCDRGAAAGAQPGGTGLVREGRKEGWSAIRSVHPLMRGVLQSWSLCRENESSEKWSLFSASCTSMRPTLNNWMLTSECQQLSRNF